MGIPIPSSGSVTEDNDVGGVLTVSGDSDLLFVGDDSGAWTAETIAGSYGSQLVISDDGTWTYTADNSNAAIQALDSGQTLTEVFNVTSTGGPSTVTITINGVDEPPCFVAGTLIDTPHGPRAVEDLQPGDIVLTRDAGPQEIRWAGKRHIDLLTGVFGPAFRPVRLQKDCFGPGVPDRDVLISPMHRVLLRDPLAQLITGDAEVLCPAHQLINGYSIVQEEVSQVTYHHLLLDEHHLLGSSGCETESFYPGEIGLNGFLGGAREELFDLFPEMRALQDSYGPAARPVLKHFEATLLADRYSAKAKAEKQRPAA